MQLFILLFEAVWKATK